MVCRRHALFFEGGVRILSWRYLWIKWCVDLRARAQTERGNTHGGATKKHEISQNLLSINLHFLVVLNLGTGARCAEVYDVFQYFISTVGNAVIEACCFQANKLLLSDFPAPRSFNTWDPRLKFQGCMSIEVMIDSHGIYYSSAAHRVPCLMKHLVYAYSA